MLKQTKQITIGRLTVGTQRYFSIFIDKTFYCGCVFGSLGFFWFLWHNKECKCVACKQYVCKCETK